MKPLKNLPPHCPIGAHCTEAYDLLGRWEKAIDLGILEFLPAIARPAFDRLYNDTSELLTRVVRAGKKRGRRNG